MGRDTPSGAQPFDPAMVDMRRRIELEISAAMNDGDAVAREGVFIGNQPCRVMEMGNPGVDTNWR